MQPIELAIQLSLSYWAGELTELMTHSKVKSSRPTGLMFSTWLFGYKPDAYTLERFKVNILLKLYSTTYVKFGLNRVYSVC